MGASVLVANRGEIALRVFRTARRLGLGCVALYSDADAGAPFVRAADRAIRIGPPPPEESYLRVDRIIDAARQCGASLVHPGYGFLAEDPALAEACAAAGLEFVGPPADVLRLVGDKSAAKRLAAGVGVPVLSADLDDGQDDESVRRAAEVVGYPVVLKPAAGGGGKGMAVVREPAELRPAVESARRVAESAFGDGRLIVERYVTAARHVEVQVVADRHGNVVHLFERDCSVQRRHQKVIEESPSPAVDEATRRALCDAAVRLATAAGYVGAGTFEFLVGGDDPPGFGFIETNARLQVEHPVTELVTGLDLVELQLRVALGEPLPIDQADVGRSGHAIEARVYAESPRDGFLPRSGRVLHVRWPAGVRVDAGVEEGTEVGAWYDPMLAKLVAWAPTRAEALEALRGAVGATEVLGVETNVSFLGAVLRRTELASGTATTAWLDEAAPALVGDDQVPDQAVALAAGAEAAMALRAGGPDPWERIGPWRVAGRAPVKIVVRTGGCETALDVRGEPPSYRVSGYDVAPADGCHAWTVDGVGAAAAPGDGRWFVWWDADQHEIMVGPAERRPEQAGRAHLGAPMPGTVIAVRVAAGDPVTRGQELVVVEAMKMEHPVRAPADGVVRAVLCAAGDRVDRGQPLVDVEAAG